MFWLRDESESIANLCISSKSSIQIGKGRKLSMNDLIKAILTHGIEKIWILEFYSIASNACLQAFLIVKRMFHRHILSISPFSLSVSISYSLFCSRTSLLTIVCIRIGILLIFHNNTPFWMALMSAIWYANVNVSWKHCHMHWHNTADILWVSKIQTQTVCACFYWKQCTKKVWRRCK